jgi:hypothetical protein
MALARVQYTQQVAGNKNFTVPFPYISRDHIYVSVNGTDVDFSWLNSTTVQLTTAPVEGDLVDVRRETEKVNLLVDFQDASTITEEQLDLSAKQAFFIAQEAFDATGATLAVANDGSYSANNRKLSNVADPTLDTDAATQGWVKAQYQSGKDAHQERLKAEAARDAAQTSETNAANSEANALSYRNTANSHRIAAANSASAAATSETNAANSAAAAKASEDDVAANAAAAATSETNAANSATSAANSASSASSSASAAGNYATSADQSRAKASLWAEAAEDSAVEPGKYSAKHHAAKASSSASSASMSATNAANYRDTANDHRLAAADSAAQAASSATAASNSASAAATSETNAANSATEAAGYAAGVNMPSALGNGGKMIRQKADESGFEYFASPGTGGGLEADLLDGRHGSEFIQLDIEKSANITSANWVTIATCSGGRAYGEFYIYDTTSSRHNSVKIIAQTSFGKNFVSVLGGARYGTRTIAHVRILYSTADRTYGGARLQVYCENPSFTLYVRSALVSQLSGWQGWTPVTPVIEGTPSGWAQDFTSRWDDITSGVANGGIVQVKTATSGRTRYLLSASNALQSIPGLAISFTPKFAGSKIVLTAHVIHDSTYVTGFAFTQDGASIAPAHTYGAGAGQNNQTASDTHRPLITTYQWGTASRQDRVICDHFQQTVDAGSTSARTYRVAGFSSWSNGSQQYGLYINDRSGGGMASVSHFTVMEIKQ